MVSSGQCPKLIAMVSMRARASYQLRLIGFCGRCVSVPRTAGEEALG